MSDYVIYYYNKYRKAETNEEKLNILIDFIMTTKKNEEFSEFFGIDLDVVEFFDKFDIEDFMENNADELLQLWKCLLKNYDIEDE